MSGFAAYPGVHPERLVLVTGLAPLRQLPILTLRSPEVHRYQAGVEQVEAIVYVVHNGHAQDAHRLGEVEDRGYLGMGEDRVGVADVGLHDGGRADCVQEVAGVQDHERVEVDVDHAIVRIDALHHRVRVVDGRQAGTQVGELVDPRICGQARGEPDPGTSVRGWRTCA